MKRMIPLLLTALLTACHGGDNGAITASGTIEATEVTVNAKTGGQIMKLLASEGSEVKRGDTLAEIDRATLEIQLKQAKANHSFARAEYDRAKKLSRGGSITPRQLDDAHTRLSVAESQKELLEKYIADSYVAAPVDGTLTQKSVEEGDHVLPNGQMFRISRLSTVNLMIYVNEIELARVKLGQKAQVLIDARPDAPFQGTVVYISPVAEFTPKNVQTKDDRTKLVFGVKIEIPNPGRELKPGMPADARIITE